ncbi:hypothetical protein [Streptomyces sp. MCA2]|nr:hypothetical protein [Streptomyces sp. MCA2]
MTAVLDDFPEAWVAIAKCLRDQFGQDRELVVFAVGLDAALR